MRKRVALARALAARPKLLLLDEPASGLAEDELAELGGLIRELAAETSLVIVEHHMDLMMSVCDSLVVLDFGKVISRGSPPGHPGRPGGDGRLPGRERSRG